MTGERWRQIDELFAAALELDGGERQMLLASLQDDVRTDVEAMLAFERASSDFLETPAFDTAARLLTGETDLFSGAATDSFSSAGEGGARRGSEKARFIPGDLVANRYRIAGLLGRGGMGEVYRADDLRLRQPVALKFLAESLSRSGAALARFHREVSVARQISHRHVCRVYDIGEHAGMHFLSMELVRGEELSSLLKRIGRLPADKAVQTARQLCAGLAAIHAAGVLHRDLKPANIMLDEHGDVRITDFGIAALTEGVSGAEAMIGTPAYMSPEQRAGGELTTRSDIYSLGLVLHEFFTGKRPSETPTTADVDPRIERVILRCLERDPARRPASALQVAAALPGGDPLAAALAAGETPSPQMVAATPLEGSLRPAIALSLVAAIFGGFVLLTLLAGRASLPPFLPLERSPEVLREKAAELARTAGYAAPLDRASGFALDYQLLRYLGRGRDPARWQKVRGKPLFVFWYRHGSEPLVPRNSWTVLPWDPPNDVAGMVAIELSSEGLLSNFEGSPPQVDDGRRAGVADWQPFFAAAGLDRAAFREVPSQWLPPRHSDARFAWSGVRDGMPVRIEAASYRGQPTYFDVIGPWRTPPRQPHAGGTRGKLIFVLYFGAIVLGVSLAWRNVKLGRGDRRGAFRLTLFVFLVRLVYWAFSAHHTTVVSGMVDSVISGLQSALYWGVLIGLLHLALEPFVRRRWPHWIISWSRLLAGDTRDPLVGRDILIGGAIGTATMFALWLPALASQLASGRWLPALGSPRLYDLGFRGARGFMLVAANQTSGALLFSFVLLSVLLFFTMITRRPRIGIAMGGLALYLAMSVNNPSTVERILLLLVPLLVILAVTRFGVLTLITALFFVHLSVFTPMTTDVTAWHATVFLMDAALLAIITIAACRIAVAGQPFLRAGLLDD